MRFCYSARTQNHNAIPLSATSKAKTRTDRMGRVASKCGWPEEVVLGVLRARLIDGMTKDAAAAKYGVDVGSAEGWFRGYNKGHLLDQVLREAGQ